MLLSAEGNPVHIKAPTGAAIATVGKTPNMRCPHCMHMGAFTSVIQQDLQIAHHARKGEGGAIISLGMSIVGIRVCPNSECRGIVLVVIDTKDKVVALPSEVLDFDPNN